MNYENEKRYNRQNNVKVMQKNLEKTARVINSAFFFIFLKQFSLVSLTIYLIIILAK